MSAILDVKTLIERYDRPVLQRTRAVYDRIGVVPKLAVILTSDDPGSVSYLKGVQRFGSSYGVEVTSYSADTQEQLEACITECNNSDIHGIMVLYPTPFEQKDTWFMNKVLPEKDVEGLHFSHLGYLVQFEKYRDIQQLRKLIIPPTAKGIMYILKRYAMMYDECKTADNCYPDGFMYNPFTIESKRITIINDSLAVGRSLALMMLNENGSVQVCHRFTPFDDTRAFVRQSDIIVSAVPSEKFVIPSEDTPERAIVIDISFEGNFEYPSVMEKAFRIAPKWNLCEKGNRINDMTLHRLISNLFYLVTATLPDEYIREIEEESI